MLITLCMQTLGYYITGD